MSYCRWSSDDYLCDLYVYESLDGFMVHVARSRRGADYEAALPPRIDASGPIGDWFDAWSERHQAVSEMLDDYESHDIGLPHDGQDAAFDTAEEAADAIEWLAAVGYRVPAGLVDDLRSGTGQ